MMKVIHDLCMICLSCFLNNHKHIFAFLNIRRSLLDILNVFFAFIFYGKFFNENILKNIITGIYNVV